MAGVYEIDFEDVALEEYPDFLTRRWATGQPPPIVDELSGPVAGFTKALFEQRGSNSRELNSIDAIDSDPDRANLQFRSLVYTGAGGPTSTITWALVARASGTSSETGYVFSLTRNSGRQLGLIFYKNGSATTNYSPVEWASDTYYWVEGEISGTDPVVLTIRLFSLEDTETPLGEYSIEDSAESRITSAGWVGIGGFTDSQNNAAHLYTAVATGSADLPPFPGEEPTEDPVAFSGTVPNQQYVQNEAITPLDLSTYFSGDFAPFTYTVQSGTLPTGLSLNSSTGVISGTPTTIEEKTGIVIRATDDESNTADTNAFNINVVEEVVAVKGVRVLLHNEAGDPVASEDNIQVAWFDEAEPKDFTAPVFKSSSATTDADGLLEIDIDGETSLDLDDVGFLIAYKLDGSNHENSPVFASQLAVQDIS